MPAGKYQVVFTSGDETTIDNYAVTLKEAVGIDEKINSKATGEHSVADGKLVQAIISGIELPEDSAIVKEYQAGANNSLDYQEANQNVGFIINSELYDFRTFSSFQKEATYSLAVTQHFLPNSPVLNNHLSTFCLCYY